MRTIPLAILVVALLCAAPAEAAKRKISLTAAKAKVLKDWRGGYDEGTYAVKCARDSRRKATCYLVRTAGTGPDCGRAEAKMNRRGRVTAGSWGYECASIPKRMWPKGAAMPTAVDSGPAPAPTIPAPESPPPSPGPPVEAPAPPAVPAPPASLPNPNGYYKGQMCQTDNEADYRAAGFTCQASGAESCIYTDYGTTCIPIYVLFPLNADGTVGSRR